MLSWQFRLMFYMFGTSVMYLDIRIDNDNEYDDGESSNKDN